MNQTQSFVCTEFLCRLILSLVILASAANAVTPSATFTTRTHPFLGNNHIAADFPEFGQDQFNEVIGRIHVLF
jgi:hypothetical protein